MFLKSGKAHTVNVIDKKPFKFRVFFHMIPIWLKIKEHKWKWNYTANWDTDFESCSICGEYKEK